MKHFSAVRRAYQEADGHFEFLVDVDADQEDGGGDTSAIWQGYRQYNAYAYFVLLWSQVEAEINHLCDELVRRKRDDPAWDARRAWDLIGEHGPKGDRLLGPRDLMDRVALLCKKGGRVYNRLNELYRIRSRIAHGDLLLGGLDTAEIAKELEALIGELKATP